jgi:hypothetical protein
LHFGSAPSARRTQTARAGKARAEKTMGRVLALRVRFIVASV